MLLQKAAEICLDNFSWLTKFVKLCTGILAMYYLVSCGVSSAHSDPQAGFTEQAFLQQHVKLTVTVHCTSAGFQQNILLGEVFGY